jgi:DNA invertase Pin-like site-specific DNA recombinase
MPCIRTSFLGLGLEGEAEGYDGIDEGRLVTPRKCNLNVSSADKLRIVELVSQGNSYTSVAKIVKVDRRTVARIFQR